MPIRSDSLPVAITSLGGQVRMLSEPVAVAILNGMGEFLKAHVWDPPNHIYLMMAFYGLDMGLVFLLHSRRSQLNVRVTLHLLKKTFQELLGALILLFVGTGAEQITRYLFFLPLFFMGILIMTIILLIADHLSELRWITPAIHRAIKSKLKNAINELNELNNLSINEKDSIKQPEDELHEPMETDKETN
jgi:hypothetical protein